MADIWKIFPFRISQAQRQHFSPEDGDMKLKCTASIGDIYWQVNEKSAEGFKSKRDSHTVYNTFVRDEDGPQALDSPHGLSSGWNSGRRGSQSSLSICLSAFLSVVFISANLSNWRLLKKNWKLFLISLSEKIPCPFQCGRFWGVIRRLVMPRRSLLRFQNNR